MISTRMHGVLDYEMGVVKAPPMAAHLALATERRPRRVS